MAIAIRNSIVMMTAGALVALCFGQYADTFSIKEGMAAEIIRGAEIPEITPDNSANTYADTIDGVLFTISTDKKNYSFGDSVRVSYSIKNRSMGTILYDFNTICQFDLQLVDMRGTTIYSLLSSKPCVPDSSHIRLSPSAGKTATFDPVLLKLKKTDSLSVKAQMAGYPLSAMQVKLWFETTESAPAAVALEGRTGNKPILEFNHETKMLIIRIDRAQRLTISAFILTGQKVNKLSCEKFLAPGTHLISFNNKKLSDGVVVFKVEGNGFSESKTINLSR